ncbi:MAG: hypothetical protein R2873_15185 [Caldilineaceae bacterium]
MVLTTHQLDVAESLCDEVAIMSLGGCWPTNRQEKLLDLFRQEYYRIRVQGHLTTEQLTDLAHFTAIHENGHTILSGVLPAGTDLYIVVEQLRRLDLPLVSLTQTEANLEEIFVELMDRAARLPKPPRRSLCRHLRAATGGADHATHRHDLRQRDAETAALVVDSLSSISLPRW